MFNSDNILEFDCKMGSICLEKKRNSWMKKLYLQLGFNLPKRRVSFVFLSLSH